MWSHVKCKYLAWTPQSDIASLFGFALCEVLSTG
jgi:hypothetical protein